MERKPIPHRAWIVCLNRKRIDVVFFDRKCDADYVRRALINHDGYDPAITVRKG